jgi:hypothetical protein
MTGAGDFLTDPSGNRFIVESNVGNVTLNSYLAGLPDLNIAVFGDSHFNGPTTSAVEVVSGATDAGYAFGIDGDASPLDRMWAAAGGDDAFFRANSSIGNVSGSSDGNLGLAANVGSDVISIPRMLRRAFPMRCNIIRVANFGIGGASSYSWSGEMASLNTNAVTNANDGDTMAIGGVSYTFRTTCSVANDVLIGASANATNQNLGHAVNAEGGTPGTDYGTGTAVNPNVFCPATLSTKYLKFSFKATGTAGNSSVVTSSTTARIAVASTVDLSPQLSQTMVLGSAVSAIYNNAKSTLAAGGGMVPNFILLPLGTNDALRVGWRSVGYQTEMQKTINNIHTDWPNAKVILWKPPPVSSGPTLASIVVPAVAALVAANSGFVSAIDMNTPGAGTGDAALRRPDGVHLTSYGGPGVKSQLFSRETARWQGWAA